MGQRCGGSQSISSGKNSGSMPRERFCFCHKDICLILRHVTLSLSFAGLSEQIKELTQICELFDCVCVTFPLKRIFNNVSFQFPQPDDPVSSCYHLGNQESNLAILLALFLVCWFALLHLSLSSKHF